MTKICPYCQNDNQDTIQSEDCSAIQYEDGREKGKFVLMEYFCMKCQEKYWWDRIKGIITIYAKENM